MKPFFSIITVSYNAEETITKTVQSAIGQTYGNFEIIIKDGLSTDRTIEHIPKDKRIQIIKEKDAGIYDAMNQAISLAQGQYLIFMNCGDMFASENVLQKFYDVLCKELNPIIAYGDFCVNGVKYEQAAKMTDFYLYRTPLNHQSMVFCSEAFSNVGVYDCTYRIIADYDFTHRCYYSGIPFKHISLTVCDYLGNGISESKEGIKIKRLERRKIIKNYYSAWKRAVYDIILMFTLQPFRVWFFSGHAPVWLVNIYRNIINKINSVNCKK